MYVNPQPWREAMPEDRDACRSTSPPTGITPAAAGRSFTALRRPGLLGALPHRGSLKAIPSRRRPSVLKDPHSKAGGIVWGVLDVDDTEMNDYAMADYAIEYLAQEHDQAVLPGLRHLIGPICPGRCLASITTCTPAIRFIFPMFPEGDLDDVPPAGVNGWPSRRGTTRM